MDVLLSAACDFEAERKSHGTLGFQDLLSLAASLLRNSDAARASLGRQYQRLLVDELQDTDPIQAEVCFLLASDPAQGRDWRSVTPRAGSLFVVGDPKQSIYRFRRADLETYAAAKGQFSRFGEVLQLTENFRSTKPIEAFVNGHFEAVFPPDTPGQAAFAPMHTRKPADAQHGIYCYDVVLGDERVSRDNLLAWEAPRLASWIAQRIAHDKRKPADFLVLAYHRKAVRPLAESLASWNIPVTTAGAEVPQERELGDLLLVLKLLADPENPILVVAVLEGLFFGCSPADLFEAKQHQVKFTLGAVPARRGLRVTDALEQLQVWLAHARSLPADLVLERILDDTGLLAYAAGLDLGDARAGLFMHLVDAIRGESGSGAGDLQAAIEIIERELETSDSSGNLRPDRGGAVRVMNLHKAKGLEAEVVILTCPSDLEEYPPLLHVRRDESGAVGYMHIRDSDKNTLAYPAGWQEIEAREAALLGAERERLRYVAATRAGGELVVARLSKNNKEGPRPDQSMWAPLHETLADHATVIQLENRASPGRAKLEVSAGDLALQVVGSRERLTRAAVASESSSSVTAAVHEPREEDLDLELETAPRAHGAGLTWGSAVHRAIEGLGRGRTGDGLRRYLRAVARGEGLGSTEEEISSAGDRLFAVLERLQVSPEWMALMASTERRFECRVARCEDGRDGRLLTQGTIDAAMIRDGVWTVLDWKTDAAGEEEWAVRAVAYDAQVARYTEILSALGQQTAQGRLVRVQDV